MSSSRINGQDISDILLIISDVEAYPQYTYITN